MTLIVLFKRLNKLITKLQGIDEKLKKNFKLAVDEKAIVYKEIVKKVEVEFSKGEQMIKSNIVQLNRKFNDFRTNVIKWECGFRRGCWQLFSQLSNYIYRCKYQEDTVKSSYIMINSSYQLKKLLLFSGILRYFVFILWQIIQRAFFKGYLDRDVYYYRVDYIYPGWFYCLGFIVVLYVLPVYCLNGSPDLTQIYSKDLLFLKFLSYISLGLLFAETCLFYIIFYKSLLTYIYLLVFYYLKYSKHEIRQYQYIIVNVLCRWRFIVLAMHLHLKDNHRLVEDRNGFTLRESNELVLIKNNRVLKGLKDEKDNLFTANEGLLLAFHNLPYWCYTIKISWHVYYTCLYQMLLVYFNIMKHFIILCNFRYFSSGIVILSYILFIIKKYNLSIVNGLWLTLISFRLWLYLYMLTLDVFYNGLLLEKITIFEKNVLYSNIYGLNKKDHIKIQLMNQIKELIVVDGCIKKLCRN